VSHPRKGESALANEAIHQLEHPILRGQWPKSSSCVCKHGYTYRFRNIH